MTRDQAIAKARRAAAALGKRHHVVLEHGEGYVVADDADVDTWFHGQPPIHTEEPPAIKPYSVSFWGSKPGTADDCWTTDDFDNLAAAVACFESPVGDHLPIDSSVTAWIMLDGPDVHRERQNPDFRPNAAHDDLEDWHREQRMQAAMAHGVAGWNDYE